MQPKHRLTMKALRSSLAMPRSRILAIFGASLVLWIFSAHASQAFSLNPFDWLFQLIAAIEFGIIYILGNILIFAFDIFKQVAQYNGFLHAAAVEKGWVLVRDVANMFFIMVLLVISFGTLFKIQQYRFSALLRQVVIMAILINFSKTIVGFFIDLVQIVMLTFVNAFADTTAYNVINGFGLGKFLTFDPGNNEISQLALMTTLFIGMFMVAIATIIIILYALLLLIRIVALWFLTVLSPLAFVMSTFPGTRGYASQWWAAFWKYAVVGPVLAFFLWLSMAIVQPTITKEGGPSTLLSPVEQSQLSEQTAVAERFARLQDQKGKGIIGGIISGIGNTDSLLSFMISTILLVVSLQVAAQSGVIGGELAAKLAKRIERFGVRRATSPFRAAASLYKAHLAAPVERGLIAATGAVAGKNIPILANAMARVQSRVVGGAKAREEATKKQYENVRSRSFWERMNTANIRPGVLGDLLTSATKRTMQREGRKKHPGAFTGENEAFRNMLVDMDMETWNKLKNEDRLEVAQQLEERNMRLYDIAPDKAEATLRRKNMNELRAFGFARRGVDPRTGVERFYRTVDWHRNENRPVVNPEAEAVLGVNSDTMYGPPDVTAVAARNPDSPRYSPRTYSPQAGISREAFLAEQQRRAAGGITEPQFRAADQRERERERRNIRAGRLYSTRNMLAGGGERGRYFAADFNDPELRQALGFSGSENGATFHSPQQLQAAAAVFSEKFRKQTEGDLLAGGMNPQEAARQATEQARQFGDAIRNSPALRVYNSMGTGSLYQAGRHEKIHPKLEAMDDAAVRGVAAEFDAVGGQGRLRELLGEVGKHWQGGEQMSDVDKMKELLAELMAARGAGEQYAGAIKFKPEEMGIGLLLRKAIEDRERRGPATSVADVAAPKPPLVTGPTGASKMTAPAGEAPPATPKTPGVLPTAERPMPAIAQDLERTSAAGLQNPHAMSEMVRLLDEMVKILKRGEDRGGENPLLAQADALKTRAGRLAGEEDRARFQKDLGDLVSNVRKSRPTNPKQDKQDDEPLALAA